MATKKKDNKGPATQSTGTQGVNAVGVNHGTKPNYAPGFTDVAGSPSYQQYGQQYPQQAPVVVQPVQQQVPTQTATNAQQNPVVQPAQPVPTVNGVQPVQQQQFSLPQQITVGGKTITLQQPIQQGQMPQQVTIGNNTYQMPTQTGTKAPAQQPKEPTAAQQNAEYEAQKAQADQDSQLINDALDAGVNPNAVRSHDGIAPTREQVVQATEKAKAEKDDEYVKTVMERIDELRETPEDRKAREKREARQRRFAAISEGLANVFNVGGAVAGARPAQWKSAVGDLYANQEAESDKRRLEYRQALKDMIDYRTAIRNGDIATARLIEERRRNDYLEQKALADIASKEQANRIAQEKHENNEKRAQVKADDQHRAANTKEEIDRQKLAGTYSASKNTPKKSSGRGSNSTGKQAKRSANASRRRVTKNRLKSLKNKNKK